MTMDITKSIAFTGHRSERICQAGMLHLYLDIVSEVRRLYSLGYRNFLSGMAEGFDLLAAQAVASLKTEYTDIHLIAVVPFRQQSNRYRPENKSLYDRMMKVADEVVTLHEDYRKGCFLHRNDYLVDNSEIALAYWDKQPYGGTYYTVGKARMMNRTIINLYK
ncbi:MAG: SLOG family protein [Parabacteroides sp.]|nr:SLOG family protein [Parabacteroides sp.]